MCVALLGAGRAEAGDVLVLWGPNEIAGSRTYAQGAAISSFWFKFAMLDTEVVRVSSDPTDSQMTSFVASALLSVPIKALRPYGGVGVGVFQQKQGSLSDLGTLKVVVGGLRLVIADLIVLRGDYRKTTLSGFPLFDMDSRITFGIGITF